MSHKSDLASHRILSVTEEELSRIVLDIHDGPVQNLFAALSLLTRLQNEIAKHLSFEQLHMAGVGDVVPIINQVETLIESSLREIKFFVGTFRPPEFLKRPFASIVEGLVIQHEEWSGHTVELTVEPLPDEIALPVKIALYRLLQEALSNSYRHSGADRQWVRLWSEDGIICLEVYDRGRGFEPPPLEGPAGTEHEAHIGLRGMRDRIALLDGEFHLTSRPGQGTRIVVKVAALA
jgi:signal transduction histidine kinase